jgi:hypothetical protein
MTDPDARFHAALPDALALIGAVHTRDPEVSHALLRQADLPALAVVLASLVDDNRRVAELLAWSAYDVRLVPSCDPAQDGSTRAVHGTRSRYTAGCRGAACRQAESEYQHERYLRSKARATLREAS